MLSRNDVVRAAHENGFEDVGFTTAGPFESHREFLTGRQEECGWAEQVGLELMNVARAMGNTRAPRYVTDLIQAFKSNDDHRVKAMAVWALGRIGGETALKALRGLALLCKDVLLEEVNFALEASVRAIK